MTTAQDGGPARTGAAAPQAFHNAQEQTLTTDPMPAASAAAWTDGDELAEMIRTALWAHCKTDERRITDDPRTIAAVAAAVARAMQPPSVDRAAVLREGEAALREKAGQLSELAEETMRRDLEETAQVWHEAASALAQLAAETPQPETQDEFTEARAAFMQIGRTPSLEGLRAELHIEGHPPIVGRYCGASMGRMHDVPGHEHLLAIDPRLIFEYADEQPAVAPQPGKEASA